MQIIFWTAVHGKNIDGGRMNLDVSGQGDSIGLNSWWKHFPADSDAPMLNPHQLHFNCLWEAHKVGFISPFFARLPLLSSCAEKIENPNNSITMGFDCGFDIYPRLETTASNKETYRRFLDEIIRTYENVYDKEGRMIDGKVLDIPPFSPLRQDLHLVHGRRVSTHAWQSGPL
jgi:hypothetical protein